MVLIDMMCYANAGSQSAEATGDMTEHGSYAASDFDTAQYSIEHLMEHSMDTLQYSASELTESAATPGSTRSGPSDGGPG